jgi:type IV secretory pathway TrbD component
MFQTLSMYLAQVVNTGEPVTAPPTSILGQIVAVLLPVVLALVSAAAAKLVTYLHGREKESKVAAAFAIAGDFFVTAFAQLRAELEADLKAALADGTVDDAERKAMVSKLVALAKRELPTAIMAVLQAVLGLGLDTWLAGKAGLVVDTAVAHGAAAAKG